MSIAVIRSIQDVREAVRSKRQAKSVIGLVPTMGALHAGHARLIEVARRECGCVIVSLFVNPIQFDRRDDYSRYPRTLETDIAECERLGADVVFAPGIEEMYPRPQRAYVEVEALTDNLCGRFRPGHFRGVATVVTKLFNIVQPDRAYFGRKDAQQLAVIRRMTADLNLPIEIVGVETVRESSGLAMSSRNEHLTPEERCIAATLYRALAKARTLILGGARDPGFVKRAAEEEIAAQPQIRLEYLEIVDPEELQPVTEIAGPVLVALAAWLGSTRLIDNVTASPFDRG